MKSFLRKLSLFTIAVTALLAFSCSPSTGGGGSGSNPLDNSNVKARYISPSTNISPSDYRYEIINFYNDNTFAVYEIADSKESFMKMTLSDRGKEITFHEEFLEASGTYTGDPTKESSTVKLHVTKEIKLDSFGTYMSYIFDSDNYITSGNNTYINITSSIFEYESKNEEIDAVINNYKTDVYGNSYENVTRPVTSLKGDCSDVAIVLDWEAINYAKQYTIYYSKENDFSKAEKLGTTGNSSYNSYVVPSAGLEKNATYYFWVKAELITGDVSEISPAFPVKFTTVNAPRIDRSYAGRTFEFYPVSGATSYKIYRSTTNDVSTAELIDTKVIELYSSYIEYTDKKLKKSGTYYYWVTAVKDGDESNYSNVFTYEFKLKRVFIKDINIEPKSVQIRWDVIDYSDSYYVYYNTENNFETATKVSDTVKPSAGASDASYSFFDLTYGERYWFWAQPVSKDPEITYEPSNAANVKFVDIPTPSLYACDNGDNRVRLAVYSYYSTNKIYRSRTDDISTAICVLDNVPSYENIYDPVPEGGTYYYWATTVIDGYESEYSDSKSDFVTYHKISEPRNLQAVYSGGTITLTWDAPLIGEAASYEIYISDYTNYNSYIKLKTVTTNSATFTAKDNPTNSFYFITSGTRYFRIKAIDTEGTESALSSSSYCNYYYFPILAPSSVTATLDYDTGAVTLSWDAVSDARYYKVYYYSSSNKITSVNESNWYSLNDSEFTTSYTVPENKLTSDYYHVFSVKAFTASDESSDYSGKSNTIKYGVDTPSNTRKTVYQSLNKLVLSWDKSADTGVEYEIYMDTSGFLETATLLDITSNNSYIYTYNTSGEKYFWIVAKHGVLKSKINGYTIYAYISSIKNEKPTIGTESAITETDVIDLSTETWSSTKLRACELVSGKNADFYKFQVQAGKNYAVKWNDQYQYDCSTKPTLDVKVEAYFAGDSSNSLFYGADSGCSAPQQFVSPLDGWVIIKVYPYSSSERGTYELSVYEVE